MGCMTRDDLPPAVRLLIDCLRRDPAGEGTLRGAGLSGYSLIAPVVAGGEPEPLCNFAKRTVRAAVGSGLVLCAWAPDGRTHGFLTPIRLSVLGSGLAVQA